VEDSDWYPSFDAATVTVPVKVPGIVKRPFLSVISTTPERSPATTSTLAPARGRDAVSCTDPFNENTGGDAGAGVSGSDRVGWAGD
jgi:hypothetical protein